MELQNIIEYCTKLRFMLILFLTSSSEQVIIKMETDTDTCKTETGKRMELKVDYIQTLVIHINTDTQN